MVVRAMLTILKTRFVFVVYVYPLITSIETILLTFIHMFYHTKMTFRTEQIN